MGTYKRQNGTAELYGIMELASSLQWHTLYTCYKRVPIFRWASMNFSTLVEVNKACKSKHLEIIITKCD